MPTSGALGATRTDVADRVRTFLPTRSTAAVAVGDALQTRPAQADRVSIVQTMARALRVTLAFERRSGAKNSALA